MIMNIFQKIVLASFVTGLLPTIVLAQTAPAADPAQSGTFGDFEVGLPGITNKSIDSFIKQPEPILAFINNAVNVVIAVLVIIGVISIVIGGYMYMTAGGDGGRVKLAKETIAAALVGIFLSLISVVILNTINTYLGTGAQEPVLGQTGEGGAAGGGAGAGGAGSGPGSGGAATGNPAGNNTLPIAPNQNELTATSIRQMGLQVPPEITIQKDDLVVLADGKVLFRGATYNSTEYSRLADDLQSSGASHQNEVRILTHKDAVVTTNVFPLREYLSNNAGIPFENISIPQLTAGDDLRGKFITGP